MPPANSRPLTERQQAVMERIDRRVPIKVIAQELGVSETRINQHIRALKDVFDVDSLNELVEQYRASRASAKKAEPPAVDEQVETFADAASVKPLSESVYTKNQLPEKEERTQESSRVDPGEIVFNDVLPVTGQAPWMRPEEPKVVPGVLDGEHAILLRLAAIVGIAFGVLAAVVLTVTAAIAISEALDGRATVSVDEEGLAS